MIVLNCRRLPGQSASSIPTVLERVLRLSLILSQVITGLRPNISSAIREDCLGTAHTQQNHCDAVLVYFALAHASMDGGLSPPLLTAVTR